MNIRGRFIGVAAIAAISVSSLAACSNDESDTDDKNGEGANSRGPISFAMGKNDTDKLTPIIDKWNAAHPDEKVELKELAGEADAQRDTLVTSLQANSGEYDVMSVDVTDTAYFAANGWLEPLEGDVSVNTSGLLPSAVDSASYRGKLYAVPQNTNAQLLFYRTDLQPEAPKNWDELTQSCEKAEEAGVDCLVTQLKQYEGLTANATEFIHSWGGSVVGEDGKTPEVENPDSKEGLKALVDGYKNGTIAQKSDGFAEEDTHLAFLAGETMYAINWPYMWDKAKTDETSTVKDTVAVAPIVGKDGTGKSTLGGYNNGINVNSEHKDTARDFVEFIISEENQKEFAEQSFPPVLKSIYDDPALLEEFPYMAALKTALENAKPRPVTPFYPAVSKAIQDNTYAALKGGRSVDDAAAEMATAIKTAANN